MTANPRAAARNKVWPKDTGFGKPLGISCPNNSCVFLQESCLAVFCLTGAAPAFCKDFLRREVFGAIGIGKTYDDEGSLGSGLNAGGGFGYRVSQRFGVEAEVNGFRTRRDFGSSFAPFQANGAHVMGSGLLYLSRGRAKRTCCWAGVCCLHVKNGFGGGPGMSRTGSPSISAGGSRSS